MRRKSLTRKIIYRYIAVICTAVLLMGCGSSAKEEVSVNVEKTSNGEVRSNEPICLVPTAAGTMVIGDDKVSVDISNASEGYFYVTYSGDNTDVKMQIICNDGITYTYKISVGDTVVPLTQGSGEYQIIVYEGMGNGQYSVLFAENATIDITNEFGAFLYPNYYVDFTDQSEAVAKGSELAASCTCDLEVIGAVYDYVIGNISYDHDEAENVGSDYVPDVDEILDTKKGICFDYASLMSAMLRSQRIPTKLEIGYAGDAYHAWVTTYVQDIGWINGIIQFDGTEWTLMDPTFAANADAKTLKKFVGDGSNYTTKYEY